MIKIRKLDPVHPGEVLNEEFLKPFKLSQNQIAKNILVSPRRINEIIHGKRKITADTALRLGKYFGTSPKFWLGLQNDYELDVQSDVFEQTVDRKIAVFKRKKKRVAKKQV